MTIPYFIGILGNIIWLLIPFRQVKTKYFFFFLVEAITCALVLIDILILIHPARIYLGQGVFLIIALYDFKKIPYYPYFLLSGLIISIVLSVFLPVSIITFLLVIEHVLIFFIILKNVVIYINQTTTLNLFHFILLLLEITTITRFIVIIGNIQTGIIFFYLTAAFGILIGIFFLFYNELNSPKFSLADKSIMQ